MLKFVQSLLLGLVVFSAQSSMAAGPCVHQRSEYECVNYPTGECFWDTADQRCENRNNNEDACSRMSYYNCMATRGCFWDQDDQRCERRD
ncbi:MAG: hypothetical protein WCK49_07795 [Myxococcaceae bacterium]